MIRLLSVLLILACAAKAGAQPRGLRLQDVPLLLGNANSVFAPAGSVPAFEVQQIADAGRSTNERAAEIVNERHHLLMLAAMAYVYTHRAESPSVGFDIAALVAWDVDDITARPPLFVIDRNRVVEKRGWKYHAEPDTIDKAYAALRKLAQLPESARTPQIRSALGTGLSLSHSTIYTTLEPCPMCHSTILMTGIPKAVYCMEDPGLRDVATRQPLPDVDTHMTNRAYGFKLTTALSSLPMCRQTNAAMWDNFARWREGGHPEWGAGKYFIITDYIRHQAASLYGPAFETLSSYSTQYPENVELLEALKEAVGRPAGESR